MGRPDQDIALMLRTREGDLNAFEDLVDRHKARVFSLVYRFLGRYGEAEDLAQEVFLQIYRARASYEPTAKFTTWLYTITKNTCLKSVRRKRFSLVSLDEDVRTDEGNVQRQIADEQALSPAEDLLAKERSRMVREAIAKLPETQRMALVMNRYDGLSYEEIGEVMGLSEKAVKSLLHRARSGLKQFLEKYIKT